MSSLKISALPRKSALAVNDLIPIVDLQFGVQNYVNKKTTIGDIVATVSTAVADLSGAVTSVNDLAGAVVINVSNLGDTTIVEPAQGDILRYDAETGKWANIPFIVDGKIPADYLPSYVDDVVEYDSLVDFPEIGESGKIYVAIDTRSIYRWSGSLYVAIGITNVEITWDDIQNVPQAIQDVGEIADFAQYITDSNVITENFEVKAVDQGVYSDGAEVTAGTPLETVIKNMLQKVIPAVYRQPIFTLNTAPSTYIYEIGTVLNVTLSVGWDKRDAGDPTAFRFLRGSSVIHEVAAAPGATVDPATATHQVAVALDSEASVSFSAQVDYEEGPQLFDNMGAPSGTPLPAQNNFGSNSRTFIPRYKIFYGLSSDPAIDNAGILALTGALSTTRAQTRVFNASNQFIYFAWPASYGDGSFIVGNLPNSAWQKTTVQFTNSLGYTASYLVYRSEFAQNGAGISVQVT
jgi:hypothetical protein